MKNNQPMRAKNNNYLPIKELESCALTCKPASAININENINTKLMDSLAHDLKEVFKDHQRENDLWIYIRAINIQWRIRVSEQ